MILINVVKGRDISSELAQLKALLRRLTRHHTMYTVIENNYRMMRSSIRGEREVEFPLQFLNKKEYLILHNLRLADENGYFQIDSLLLHENFILILEIKNWYGTIFFGENGQVTRVGDDGKEEGFPNPIPQVKLQKHRLGKWLRSYGLKDLTLDYLVVISLPSTMIKSSSSNHLIPEKVIHNNDLLFRIQSLKNIYTSPIINMEYLKRLSNILIQAHTPKEQNILDNYNLTKEELIQGIFCPKCSEIPMIRNRQKWYCQKCGIFSTNAHLQAFNDYKLLVGDFISNREAREFLQVKSPYVVKRLLQTEKFKFTGTTKNRMYELEFR